MFFSILLEQGECQQQAKVPNLVVAEAAPTIRPFKAGLPTTAAIAG